MTKENDMELISETKRTLASRAIGRDVHERNGVFELRKPSVSYNHQAPLRVCSSRDDIYPISSLNEQEGGVFYGVPTPVIKLSTTAKDHSLI